MPEYKKAEMNRLQEKKKRRRLNKQELNRLMHLTDEFDNEMESKNFGGRR